MVNWIALAITASLLYILPKDKVLSICRNYYKYRTLTTPFRTIIVILEDIGLNFEKARKYAKNGSKIIIGAQNLQKAENARKDLITITRNKNIRVVKVNASDRNSLKKFAKEIANSETAVDVLINNKGEDLKDLEIIFSTQVLAVERLETHFVRFLYSPDL